MKWLNIFRRRAHEREMDDEMRFHIEMEAAELAQSGLPPHEARRRALATFGGVQRHKEAGHEARGGTRVDDLVRDLRYSARSLLRTPGYTLVVVLTLALAVAANSSIFGVAHGILFKPLPYREPERLMVIWDGLDVIGVPEAWVTGPEVVRLRREAKTFEGFAVTRTRTATVGASNGAEPLQVPITQVSANFFDILGAAPSMGRGFAAGEDAPGAPRVVVISRRFWMQRFGGDPRIVGKPVVLDGQTATIIGVLPATFRFSTQNSLASASGNADIYSTYADTLDRMNPNNHSLGVLARARSDVPMPTALQEIAAIGTRLDEEHYAKRGFTFKPVLLQERMVRDVRPALLALLGAVGVLMLIMCANLAVLALVRAARRERELTVRRAIGASHGRVTRQILTETVLLSLVGAAAGTLLGSWALRALLGIAPPGLPRREEISIDLTVIGVTLGVALLVGIVMGLAPVFQSLRSDISTVLREKAPSHSGSRVRRALVLTQLAMSMVLLAGTGLLLNSFIKLTRVELGYQPDNVLTIELVASSGKYQTGAPVVDLFSRYTDALRTLPGVIAVGASAAPPLSAGADQSGLYFPGAPANTGDGEKDRMLVDNAPVTPGYFTAMGMQILEGQEFDASHTDSSRMRVTVIDDLVAKRYFPDGGALGRHILLDGDSLRVIGIARHVNLYNLQDYGREQIWITHAYRAYRSMVIAVRTEGDPLELASAARQTIRSIDADQPIMSIRTMRDAVRGSLGERRLVLTLVSAFAGAALLLAALGVYGVTASAVAQRTREIGIRVALGANPRRVVWSVLSEPTRLIAIGLVVGLAATFAAGGMLEKLLYDVQASDPLTLALVALMLLVVAVLASYVPALRASRVDPIVALRSD